MPPPPQTCPAITQANADASAGTVNIQHDGTPIAGTPAPDISRGFSGIPAESTLTASDELVGYCQHNCCTRVVICLGGGGFSPRPSECSIS